MNGTTYVPTFACESSRDLYATNHPYYWVQPSAVVNGTSMTNVAGAQSLAGASVR